MKWTVILDAATGRAEALNRVVWLSLDERAALGTLLLLEEAPHPAAALVVAGSPWRGFSAPPIQAALAPHVAPALADWRADPQWAERIVGKDGRMSMRGVARMVGALRADPAALRDAVAIVLRDGDSDDVVHCIDALGGAGWRALADDQRAALLARAPDVEVLGRVWSALDDAQRETTARAAASTPGGVAQLIGRIGAAAWRATDPALRKRLIDAAVARDQYWISDTAPAWPGMTDDERARLATPVITSDRDRHALDLLKTLGAAGRATLTVEQRAALDARAMKHPESWLVLAWRAADAGRTALTDEERAVVMAKAVQGDGNVQRLLRDVGAAGWNAMRADDQARIAVVVRHAPRTLFLCPPALWGRLAGAALPPPTDVPKDVPFSWRAEDADADLGALPPAHQALVLALAPWRPEEATKDSVRVQRLLAAWDQMSADERAALATVFPSAAEVVAAAARLRGGAAAARAAAGETVVRGAATTDGAAARRIVGGMLHTSDDWRDWMASFTPTDDDSSDVWDPWRAAARRGSIADLAVCARLAAKERDARAMTLRR